jgi:hypothetical protein
MAITVLTALLVVITGFYAWVTHRIMRANERTVAVMKEQVDALTRPYVTVGLVIVPNSHIFYLRIANTGKTGANNVRLLMDRDFFQYGRQPGTNLREVSAFTQPIQQLTPGQEIVFGLAMGPQLVGDLLNPAITPPVFSVTATYSYANRTVIEETAIDVRPYRDSMRAPSPTATELAGIKAALEKLAARE